MLERPLPCVVDTNVVMRDLLRFARKGHTALRVAGQMRAIRSFAAVHVIDEVAEHLPELAQRQGIQDVMGAWSTYAEGITFVDVPRDALADDRVAQVASKDLDDVPTACLVVTLAPCISLSEDSHLIDAGLASPQWLRLALSSRDVGHASALQELFGMGFLGTGMTIAGSAKLVVKAASSPIGRVALGTGLLAAYLAAQRSQKNGWIGPRTGGRIVAKGIFAFLDEAARADTLAVRGERLIGQALVPSDEPLTSMRLARVLVLSEEPMTATAIARALIGEQEILPRTLLREVQQQLIQSPMFRQTAAHRWEVQSWEPSGQK